MARAKAKGTVVKIGDNGTPVSYTTIDGITGFSAPQRSRSTIDITDLGDDVHKYIAGLRESGEMSLTIDVDYADAGQDAVRAAFEQDDNYDFQMLVTDEDSNTTTIAFEGLVTNPGDPAGDLDAKLASTITVKVTGDVTVS